MTNLKLSCEDAVADFRLYAEGELEASAAAAVKDHLANCPDCCVEFHARKKLYTFVAESYGARRISDGFSRQADRRLQQAGMAGAVLAVPALAAREAVATPVRRASARSRPAEAQAEPDSDAYAPLTEQEAKDHRRYMASLAGLFAAFGALPAWAVSGMFHGLAVTLAVIIGMTILREDIQDTVVVTDLVKVNPPEDKPVMKPQEMLKEVQIVSQHDIKVPMPEVVLVTSDDVADVTLTEQAEVADFGEAGEDVSFTGETGERSGVGLGEGFLGGRMGGGVPLPGGGRGMIGSIGGVPFAGKKLALVFDNSLSMKSVVEFAKQAVVDFLKETKGKGTIDFYCEINEVPAHKLHILRDVQLKTSADAIMPWFEAMPKGGNDTIGEAASSMWWGFKAAMDEYPDMIVFVTDWKLHSPNREYNIQRQTEEIRKLLEGSKPTMPKCVFFTQTTGGAPFVAMEELAKLTGGTIKQIDGKKK
ncbi:MAG: hypothetical protein AMXMBFR7_09200 [Planctomycetota bacterium]